MPAYDKDLFVPAAPVARVAFRHSSSGETRDDVPMLIDTGADATLIPISVIRSLDLPEIGGRFRLIAYNGTTDESEGVYATLVFLGKNFRGEHLPIEGEVGVIGRNILNQVRLLFDGPASEWIEVPPRS